MNDSTSFWCDDAMHYNTIDNITIWHNTRLLKMISQHTKVRRLMKSHCIILYHCSKTFLFSNVLSYHILWWTTIFFYFFVLCRIIFYCIVSQPYYVAYILYCTVLYCIITALYINFVPYCDALYCTALSCIVSFPFALYYIYQTGLYHVLFYCKIYPKASDVI